MRNETKVLLMADVTDYSLEMINKVIINPLKTSNTISLRVVTFVCHDKMFVTTFNRLKMVQT